MKIFKNQLGVISVFLILVAVVGVSCKETGENNNSRSQIIYPDTLIIEKSVLADKIKGGWAGQVIGCTYGGPTEFQYKGGIIHDYVPIHWDSSLMLWWYDNRPGLYDDVYMDLTFVNVMEKHGLDAPARLHGEAFANAAYPLWHANQAARYNILNGIYPPASGYWKNNPHADDIDFQIEADFAGLMNPGLVNSSSAICDTVGHIMNYGDGWYGGVYVAAMYALAFVFDDPATIVKEALKTIPEQSTFYKCINDVIIWSKQYPDDWKRTWFETETKWGEDHGCPDGVFKDFNIDAKLNAAYIVIGMLYGDGDFGKSVDISTRCGQDSDCNPASVAGILGTMMGYSNIPDYWKQGIDQVADREFPYMTISLNDAYDISYNHALQMIAKEGGITATTALKIPVQKPVPVQLEQGFENLRPVDFAKTYTDHFTQTILNGDAPEFTYNFEGKGIVINGNARHSMDAIPATTVEIDVYIDNEWVETVKMPTDFITRKHDIYWNYDLTEGNHNVKLVLKKTEPGYEINLNRIIVYESTN
jgi:hypothetical protein